MQYKVWENKHKQKERQTVVHSLYAVAYLATIAAVGFAKVWTLLHKRKSVKKLKKAYFTKSFIKASKC